MTIYRKVFTKDRLPDFIESVYQGYFHTEFGLILYAPTIQVIAIETASL